MKFEVFAWEDFCFKPSDQRFEFKQRIERLVHAIKRNAYDIIQNFVTEEGAFKWEDAPCIQEALRRRMQLNAANGTRVDAKAFFQLLPGSFGIATDIIHELVFTSCFPQARVFAQFHGLFEWYKFECQSALQNACSIGRKSDSIQIGLVDQGQVSAVLEKSGITTRDLMHPRYEDAVLRAVV